MKDWKNIRINYGIKTGLNEAFIIDGATKDKLIAEDPKSAEIIRPILKGRDIKRYEFNFPDQWLIATHNGIPEKNIPGVNINRYPAVKKYLDQYYDKICVRDDQGDTPYNLRSCAYMDDFSKPKLMYNEITQRLSFIYVEEEIYCTNTAYLIANNNHLKYLLACLNSNLYDWYYKRMATTLGTATRMLAMHMNNLPVMMPDEEKEKEINEIIDEILDKHETDKNIKKLDSIIYHMFGLTDDEIEYIEREYR